MTQFTLKEGTPKIMGIPSGFSKLGTVLAFFLSFMVNHSIGWAIIHMIFGWFYVLYWAFNTTNFGDVLCNYLMGLGMTC